MKLSRVIYAGALLWTLTCTGTLFADNSAVPRLIDVSTAPVTHSETDRAVIERKKNADPSIDWVVAIDIDIKALEYDRFDAFLNDQHVIIYKDVTPRKDSQVVDIWQGYVFLPGDRADDRLGGLRDVRFFIRNNGRVYGSIRIDESHYTVSTLPSGKHILTKQDVSKLPSERTDDAFPNPEIDTKRIPLGGESEPDEMETIRMVIGFTAAAEQGDQPEFLDAARDAVASANKSFADSGILLQVELAAFARPNYAETSVLQTWNDLRLGHNGPLWLVHVAREGQFADVAAMVVQLPSDECGRAPLGSTVATALLVVRRSCFTQFSLAHELGHLLSANHNPENIGTPSLFPYGHGYRYQNNPLARGWMTVMSVSGGLPISRRNIWSNPLKTYLSRPTGTVETHDNARVLTETKSTVAAFFPDPPSAMSIPAMTGLPLYTPQGVRQVDR